MATPPSDAPALTEPEERERAEEESKSMLAQNSLALEAQVEERPLAKKQEELQTVSNQSGSSTDQNTPSEVSSSEKMQERGAPPRKALLKNDDTELKRVGDVSGSIYYILHPNVSSAIRRSSPAILRVL